MISLSPQFLQNVKIELQPEKSKFLFCILMHARLQLNLQLSQKRDFQKFMVENMQKKIIYTFLGAKIKKKKVEKTRLLR